MTVRRATIDDLQEVVELFDLYRVFYAQTSDIPAAETFLEERFKQEDSVIFLAVDGENSVGFVQLFPSFSSVSMERLWILNDLYVKQEVRRKGYGEKLMAKAIAFAKETNAKGLLLETAPDNVNAQELYEKIGFVQATSRYYFFSTPE